MSSQQQKSANSVAEQASIEVICIRPEMFLKKRKWAQMALDAEEEEEQEILRQEDEKFKNILAARRFLYSIGLYELEEGEILE